MKPLSPQDALFLWIEKRNQPMHVGGLQLLTPPPGASPDWCRQQAEQARQFTQAQPPFNYRLAQRTGGFFWTEDEAFDLDAHFYHLALPRPGRVRDLLALVSQLHSAPLDRGKPMWEIYLIDGVEGGRVAMYTKLHHALVDGISAMRMLAKAMSEDPQAAVVPLWAMESRQRDTAVAVAPPAPLEALSRAMMRAREGASSVTTVARELSRAIREARSNPDYVSVFQAPHTILNERISGSRRFAAQSYSLERIKAAGKKYDATLNDVVLAMCASALRRYLMELDALPAEPLIAAVPMSVRSEGQEGGNQVAMILANLGTHLADPVERLGLIRRSVQNAKERYARMNQVEIIAYTSTIMAPTGINLATGIAPHWQSFNVTVSNVPGPKAALYWNGARLDGTYPVNVVTDGMAANITLTSYADKLEFGIIACRRTVPHVQRMLDYLEQGLAELE